VEVYLHSPKSLHGVEGDNSLSLTHDDENKQRAGGRYMGRRRFQVWKNAMKNRETV
jgi:hypothetical protein